MHVAIQSALMFLMRIYHIVLITQRMSMYASDLPRRPRVAQNIPCFFSLERKLTYKIRVSLIETKLNGLRLFMSHFI